MTELIQCSCCNLTAIRIVGDTISLTIRHNGQYHTSVIEIREINRLSGKNALRDLLDSRRIPVVT